MKYSRKQRKAFKEGKRIGYIEGYSQGIIDGNPFNKMCESLKAFQQATKELKTKVEKTND